MALLVMTALLILAVCVVRELTRSSQQARAWVWHTHQVLETIQDLDLVITAMETGQRGFLLTGEESYLTPYQVSLNRISMLQGDLQRLTNDNIKQQRRVEVLAPLLRRRCEELARTMELRRAAGPAAATDIVHSDLGLALMQQIRSTLDAMTADEKLLLQERLDVAEDRDNQMRVAALVATGLTVLVLLCSISLLNKSWLSSASAAREQRDLAERLRTTLDSLTQGVAVFEADCTLIDWNEDFQRLLGLPPAVLQEGAPYASIVEYTAEESGFLLEPEDALPSIGDREDKVTYERTSATSGRVLELRRCMLPNGGFALTVTDLTRRAQSDAALREVQKMHALGQLTGGIAHDFNNLLTVILGNLEVLGAKLEKSSPLQDRIERAVWAAQSGASLTRQLLAFAQRQPLAPAPIDLLRTIPDLIPLLRRTLGEHVEIRYTETPDLWPVMTDAAQLENALLNLALNARDAMPEGGRLTIELANYVLDHAAAARHVGVRPGDYVVLSVSDTGEGIAPELLDHVVEPFFTTRPEGSGLGLALLSGFVQQCGGHLDITSVKGRGTTVRLYLPRADATAIATPQAGKAPSSATILVVEDEAAVREVACSILTDLGHRVLEAPDGERALRVFGAHAPEIDLLLTDVVMPGKIRGRELAERITAMRPEIRVLFISGYAEGAVVDHGWLEGGMKLIAKPFTRDQLARRVADALCSVQADADEAAPERAQLG